MKIKSTATKVGLRREKYVTVMLSICQVDVTYYADSENVEVHLADRN